MTELQEKEITTVYECNFTAVITGVNVKAKHVFSIDPETVKVLFTYLILSGWMET